MKKIGTVAGASIAAFALGATLAGGMVVASADSDAATDAAAPHRGPGEVVTGADAQKAIDAALAAVPGTADHAHKTPSGEYLVMVSTSDDKRIVVRLDAAFAVIDQQEVTGRGPGHRGPGTPATGEDRTRAGDAALVVVPGATVLEVFTRDEGGYAVLVRTDAGRKKVVLLDGSFAVTSVETPPAHRGRHHGPMGKDVTGAAFRKAEAAATARVNGTVMDVHKRGAKYHAMVRRDDGRMVVVTMNRDFEVTGTRSFTMHMHRGGPGAPADVTAA
jgi:hypothetical protein